MDKLDFIRINWGKQSLVDMATSLKISLTEVLEIALYLGLHNQTTPNIGRRWSEEEHNFLINNASKLSVRDASNLLYRSHYATYQRIRFLGLEEMISRKWSEKDD